MLLIILPLQAVKHQPNAYFFPRTFVLGLIALKCFSVKVFHAIELVLALFFETLASEYSIPPEKLNEAMNNYLSG
ncbi:MAG TPA: hypothetical protein VJ869_08645 [Sphaerochaeta sp.]|nr:hypothetical protein [Sphaerochaeta sp.]